MVRSTFKLVLLALVLGLQGCGALWQKSSEVTIRQPGDHMLSAPTPVLPEAREHLEFAWLSDAAYGNTPAGREEEDSRTHAAADAPAAADPNGESTCPVSQDALMANHWEVWPDFPDDGLQRKIDKFHLRVEVWKRLDPPTVAVAFGGTVFNNKNDWSANLRWFLPKAVLAGHPDEYSAVVQEFAPAFLKEFRRRLDSGASDWAFLRAAKIYSTGHSLGGGLAQQFAYAISPDDLMPRVTKVYAFDPSPVTGYYSVEQDLREANSKELLIDRVYERGEVLALLRSLTSFFVTPKKQSPTIRGVRYMLFYPATPVGGHSIHHLACRINDVVRAGVATPD